MLDFAIILSVAVAAALMLWPRVSQRKVWRATVTPLASIIGSGFLVLAPILLAAYGSWAPLVMAGLCIGAYCFGWAIRFNIYWRNVGEPVTDRAIDHLELAASWALVFAFMISVAYYLNLFGAFAVSLTPFDSPLNARLTTTAAYAVILATGWFHGFKGLEKIEYGAVALKLAIILGLLIGLAAYFFERVQSPGLLVQPPVLSGWNAITLAFGLVITVQGFETSRYLGREYNAATRIASMRLAQLVTLVIYMAYILLFAYSFDRNSFDLSETAIIDLMGQVSTLLPLLLVAAALAAQLSAAIADTSGSGGLLVELTRNRMNARQGYGLLTVIGLFLTWEADVFQIIAYASRAFALYYTLQTLIAARRAFLVRASWRYRIGFIALAMAGAMITLFGTDVESAGPQLLS